MLDESLCSVSVYNCCGERLHLNFIDRETQRLPTNTELGIAWGQKSNEMNSISVMIVVFATLTRQVAPSPTQVVRKNVLIGRIPTPGPVSHKKCRLSLAQREPSESIRRHALGRTELQRREFFLRDLAPVAGYGRAGLAKAGAKGANTVVKRRRTKNPRIDTKCLQTLVFTRAQHQQSGTSSLASAHQANQLQHTGHKT